ncbi:MAG: TRADD-N-associated membrane domain-containing protein [Roseburia faecis]|nr:MAG TPA: hypothetical protein [Caudoviricetes sp.]
MESEILGVIASLVGVVGTIMAKQSVDKADAKIESCQVEKAIKDITIENNENDNVLELMLKNVKELREYYVISKQQARKSFSAALFICFFGIFIYVLGIISVMIFDKNISVISIIGGTVVEVIAGLFFWLYREATKQLSIYHQRLGSTEKYLTVIQIIRELPEDKRIEAFQNLTMAILTDNREIISHENEKR